jgi:hypothetical protein
MDFLNHFNSCPVKAFGFADDSGLVTSGPDPQLQCKFTHGKLKEVAAWGLTNGLFFSAKKSQVVLFVLPT